MGWTWNGSANVLLRKYPELVEVPEFINRWPGLREAIEQGDVKLPEGAKLPEITRSDPPKE